MNTNYIDLLDAEDQEDEKIDHLYHKLLDLHHMSLEIFRMQIKNEDSELINDFINEAESHEKDEDLIQKISAAREELIDRNIRVR